MKSELSSDNIYNFLKKDFADAELTKNDWMNFLKTIDAPQDLIGLSEVAKRMEILTSSKLMRPPIINEDQKSWVYKINQCAIILVENKISLEGRFGSNTKKPPYGEAQKHSLYYLLFHEYKPYLKDVFFALLIWIFIAIHKTRGLSAYKRPSENTFYNACLGLRALTDEHTYGNPFSNSNLNTYSLDSMADELFELSQRSNINTHGEKTKNRICDVIKLLRMKPKRQGKKGHSSYSRSYFLPTPHRGYIPLSTRMINRSYRKQELGSWAPKGVIQSEIKNMEVEGTSLYFEDNADIKTRNDIIEIRDENNSTPELFYIQMLGISNAIARTNQCIPFKKSYPNINDIQFYLSIISRSEMPTDKRLIYMLNFYTGISISKLSRMRVFTADTLAKETIYYDLNEGCLLLPIQKPIRKEKQKISAAHYHLRVPDSLTRSLEVFCTEASTEKNDKSDEVKLFHHLESYYINYQKQLVHHINKANGGKLTPSKIGKFCSSIGLSLGIDPIILSQISQAEIAMSETQSYYTAISTRQIQKGFDKIIQRLFQLLDIEVAS